MEFFTEQDLQKAVNGALNSPDFKILEHKVEEVPNFGNTKMSMHYRIQVDIQYSNGNKHCLLLFAKFAPENEDCKNFVEANNCFEKEAHFYLCGATIIKTLLPSEISLPIPVCYFARGGTCGPDSPHYCENFQESVIVLQDLMPLSFESANLWAPMDLAHCRVVMKALAVFHSGSILLEQYKAEGTMQDETTDLITSILHQFYDMKDSIFVSDGNSLSNKIIRRCAETAASVICKIWPKMFPERNYYKKILDTLWNSWDNVFSISRASSKYTNVVCHGELCGNNLLFVYKRESRGERQPFDVKFIDLQLLRYAPPVTDILLFLHVCTRREFRKENLSHLLSYYHTEFVRTVSPRVAEKTLSLDELQMSANEMKEFGLMAAIYLIPICLSHCSQCSSSGQLSVSIDSQLNPEDKTFMLEHQESHILRTMSENRVFKAWLIETYEEYLEFVGLWVK